MEFIERRLYDKISYGATGGASYATDIQISRTRIESRNALLPHPRYSYKISWKTCDKYFDELEAMFHLVKGRFTGFRFKDWEDFEAKDVLLGTGDGVKTAYQMIKTYGFKPTLPGEVPYDRVIHKPVAGTIIGVSVNAALMVEGVDYSVDTSTGIISFAVAPASGHDVTVGGFEFDVPARFDTDFYNLKRIDFGTRALQNIKIVGLEL